MVCWLRFSFYFLHNVDLEPAASSRMSANNVEQDTSPGQEATNNVEQDTSPGQAEVHVCYQYNYGLTLRIYNG